MDDDQLRARLQAADPARSDVPVPSWTDDLVEATMQTNETLGDATPTAPRRRAWMAGAAAAAVAAVAVGGYALANSGDGSDPAGTAGETIALTVQADDPMRMCMALSPESLAFADLALSGTVDSVDGDTVTIDPDEWFKGGDGVGTVTVTAGGEEVLLEGGITFTEGERYLLTASNDGQVGVCGSSGPWSADLAAMYDAAF
jgi:hypothetical protein